MKAYSPISKILSVLVVLLLAGGPVPVSFAQNEFSDIAKSPFKDSINAVALRGAVSGYPDGTFKPLNKINRAELVTILMSTRIDSQAPAKKNCFTDVRSEWFAKYICLAKEEGIVAGYPDGTFRPDQPVRMSEAYLMAIKSFGFKVNAPTQKQAWYVPALNMVHTNTFFSKFTYLASREMTREEMAKLMDQFFEIDEGNKTLSTTRVTRSAGCGKSPPQTVPTHSVVNGVERTYITAVPATYSKDTPIPLVFAFHGRTNSNAEVRRYYGVEQAAAGGAIFVYPAGIKTGSVYTWSDPGDSVNALRDYALFDQLFSEFTKTYCINLDTVFVVGHSLGAWFTNSLACARGDVIRAIGSVGGGTTVANCSGPTAALVMHNPKDNLVPIAQGRTARDQYLKQNQCGAATVPAEPRQYYCLAYQGCAEGAPFTWCEHKEDTAYWDGSYYPHTWPRNAGKEIWKFFTTLPN